MLISKMMFFLPATPRLLLTNVQNFIAMFVGILERASVAHFTVFSDCKERICRLDLRREIHTLRCDVGTALLLNSATLEFRVVHSPNCHF